MSVNEAVGFSYIVLQLPMSLDVNVHEGSCKSVILKPMWRQPGVSIGWLFGYWVIYQAEREPFWFGLSGYSAIICIKI